MGDCMKEDGLSLVEIWTIIMRKKILVGIVWGLVSLICLLSIIFLFNRLLLTDKLLIIDGMGSKTIALQMDIFLIIMILFLRAVLIMSKIVRNAIGILTPKSLQKI